MVSIDDEGMKDRATALPGASTSPSETHVLTREHILDAIARSTDQGCTLDFSNKKLVDVGDAGVDDLIQLGKADDVLDECQVLRIALVNNLLSSLPMSFARLSRLRYLTLRSNSFSVFPEVLTTMPSLEILDFAKNNIRGLPTNPGTLVNLRVLSISKNRITRLPGYLSEFKNLTVFKADHNPFEWPPKSVMEPEDDLDNAKPEVMQRWIGSVKTWLSENVHDEKKQLKQRAEAMTPEKSEDTVVPHRTRTLSSDSHNSSFSAASSSYSADTNGKMPPLDTKNIPPSISNGVYSSPESYLPVREDSLPSSSRADNSPKHVHNVHSRNMSSTASNERQNGERRLSVQKSLPDLRLSKGKNGFSTGHNVQIPATGSRRKPSVESIQSNLESPASAGENSARGRPPRPYRQNHEPLPSISERKAPSMDFERNSYFRRLSTLPASTISRAIPKALLAVIDSIRGILFAVSQIYQSLQRYTVYTIDESLSSVLLKVLDPASTYMMNLINALDKFDSYSKRGCPPPTVCKAVIEACRDNVSIFGKAASVLSLHLRAITSRDDMRYSRQMLLVLFGSTAEIAYSWQGIASQLDLIEPLLTDDQRSPLASPGLATPTPTKPMPRKMIMIPHTPSNRSQIPPIAEHPEPPPAQPVFTRPSTAPGTSIPGPPLLRSHSAQPGGTPAIGGPVAPSMARPVLSEGRSHTSRRHAGSFSAKDLEIGRSLPANAETSPPAGGLASGSSTPTPRAHHLPLRRSPPPPLPNIPKPSPSPQVPQPSPGMHSRQSSAGQNVTLSTPPLTQLGLGPSRLVVDAPTSSMDNQALDAMANAVRAAPAVWSMLDETAGEMSGSSDSKLRDGLARAQDVTRRLGASIKAIQDGQSGVDRRALREDAHSFAKMVISLSKMIKEHGSAHKLSTQLRTDIAKLTNATQEFVMLLHVSSFATSASRPHSPLQHLGGVNGNNASTTSLVPPLPPSAGTTSTMSSSQPASAASSQAPPSSGGLLLPEERNATLDDGVGAGNGNSQNAGAGLGRSRSAQPAASTKVVSSGAPRSALPHQQVFKFGAMSPPQPSTQTSSSVNVNMNMNMNGFVGMNGAGSGSGSGGMRAGIGVSAIAFGERARKDSSASAGGSGMFQLEQQHLHA